MDQLEQRNMPKLKLPEVAEAGCEPWQAGSRVLIPNHPAGGPA